MSRGFYLVVYSSSTQFNCSCTSVVAGLTIRLLVCTPLLGPSQTSHVTYRTWPSIQGQGHSWCRHVVLSCCHTDARYSRRWLLGQSMRRDDYEQISLVHYNHPFHKQTPLHTPIRSTYTSSSGCVEGRHYSSQGAKEIDHNLADFMNKFPFTAVVCYAGYRCVGLAEENKSIDSPINVLSARCLSN